VVSLKVRDGSSKSGIGVRISVTAPYIFYFIAYVTKEETEEGIVSYGEKAFEALIHYRGRMILL
jgi:hypothetical protein